MSVQTPVALPTHVRQAMIDHAAAELPNECCGVLVGRGDTIEHAVPMRNVEPGPESYIMDPEQQIALFAHMEKAGERLLGIYHSHPRGPAFPSGADLQLAFHPEAVYMIISLSEKENPEVRGFRLGKSGFEEIALIVQ